MRGKNGQATAAVAGESKLCRWHVACARQPSGSKRGTSGFLLCTVDKLCPPLAPSNQPTHLCGTQQGQTITKKSPPIVILDAGFPAQEHYQTAVSTSAMSLAKMKAHGQPMNLFHRPC